MTTRMTTAVVFGGLVGMVLGVGSSLAVDLLPEQLEYREVFPNNTSQGDLSTVGWAAHGGPTAVQIGGTGVGNIVHMATGGAPNPNPTPVNSGSDSIGQGRTFHGGTAGEAQITWTSEYSFSGLVPTRVQWFSSHNAGPGPASVAIRVDSDWYVSNTVASDTGVVDSGWTQREIDLIATSWTPLNFTPGSVLGLSGPSVSDLPGGSITGFGFFEESYVASLRFDTFELFAAVQVPEPSTAALFGIGTVAMIARVRRRRRANVS